MLSITCGEFSTLMDTWYKLYFAVKILFIMNCFKSSAIRFSMSESAVYSMFELDLMLGNHLCFWPIYFQRSATLAPLDNEDWVAVQAMVLQQEENHVLDKLQG